MANANRSSAVEMHQLVVVGSGGVGKSCLTIRFLKDEFTNDYDPTVEENYRKNIVVDNVASIVNIIDTAGQQEYTALRDQHLKDGKGFLLVFAVNDKGSFSEMTQLKDQIVRLKDTKRVPFVICANKCDIPKAQYEVEMQAVQEYCSTNKIPLLETSAKDNINVSGAFHQLVTECRKLSKCAPGGELVKKKKKSKGGCVII